MAGKERYMNSVPITKSLDFTPAIFGVKICRTSPFNPNITAEHFAIYHTFATQPNPIQLMIRFAAIFLALVGTQTAHAVSPAFTKKTPTAALLNVPRGGAIIDAETAAKVAGGV
eukprot:scaffold14603_cov214-Alexandrium_tamarense.AAC.9